MRSTHRRRLAAAAVATGAGALALGTVSLPAVALEVKPDHQAGAVDIARSFVEPLSSGPEALRQLSESSLKTVAQRASMTVSQLTGLLNQDAARVSPSGFVTLVDDWNMQDHAPADEHERSGADVPGSPSEGSKPGAKYTIFIDFDGHTIENTDWNWGEEGPIGPIEVGAYDVDDDFKRAVWEGIAQDYAPFDVNVTITDPGEDALVKSSADDGEYGAHLLIVPDASVLPEDLRSAGGWAYMNGFGSKYLSPTMVLADNVSNNPSYIADAGSHEVGHNLGLEHHGFDFPGEDQDEPYYYGGTPAEPTAIWGPIMGAPYAVPLSQWSMGDYPNASNPEQDDLATIVDRDGARHFLLLYTQGGERWTEGVCVVGDDPQNPQPGDEFYQPNENGTCEPLGPQLTAQWEYTDRAGYAADDHGDNTDNASDLDNASGEFSADGVVGSADDADVFSLVTDGGPFSAQVAQVGNGSNVDLKLTLLDSEGKVVAENEQETSANPLGFPIDPVASGADAQIEQELETGAYYLKVEGRGQGDPANNTPGNGSGYTAYGSLGYYALTGTAEPFDAAPVTITSPEDGAEVEPSALQVSGTAEPEATVTLTIGDDKVGEAAVDAEGNWSATIESDLSYGDSTITAKQTVGTINVAETAEVTVTVPLDAPAITKPEESDTATTATPTFSGTGVAGAMVTVTIECGEDSWTGEVEVDEDGNWSFTPEESLPNGDCSVSAVQEINDTTSPAVGPVGFSVDVSSGDEGGTEDGGDEGGSDDGAENGDEDDLPDTGAGNLVGLGVGAVLLALGAALYARTRRAST